MTEVDLQLREQIDKQYRLLGFESYEDGHEELDQEVGGVLERSPAEVRDYLDRRTTHIEDRKDRRSVIKLLELRMSALRMQQEG